MKYTHLLCFVLIVFCSGCEKKTQNQTTKKASNDQSIDESIYFKIFAYDNQNKLSHVSESSKTYFNDKSDYKVSDYKVNEVSNQDTNGDSENNADYFLYENDRASDVRVISKIKKITINDSSHGDVDIKKTYTSQKVTPHDPEKDCHKNYTKDDFKQKFFNKLKYQPKKFENYSSEDVITDNDECGRSVTPELLVNRINSLPQHLQLELSQNKQKLKSFIDLNIVALKLAGMVSFDKSTDYNVAINKAWNTFEKRSLVPLRIWQQQYLSKHVKTPECIFYPFGGPDATYVTQIFPEADTYILIGLEPPGHVSSLHSLIKSNVLKNVQESLRHFLKGGFFITNYMQDQVQTQSWHGVMAPMIFELTRLGYTLLSVENVLLTKDGLQITKSKYPLGLKIVALDVNFNKKTIYYINTSLANTNRKLEYLQKFVSKFNFATFLKSASYVCYDSTSEKLVKFISTKSKFILQDDTGIKYSDLLKHFHVKFYGNGYQKSVVKVFYKHYQPDLKEATLNADNILVKDMDFTLGYNFMQSKAFLMLCIQKQVENEFPSHQFQKHSSGLVEKPYENKEHAQVVQMNDGKQEQTNLDFKPFVKTADELKESEDFIESHDAVSNKPYESVRYSQDHDKSVQGFEKNINDVNESDVMESGNLNVESVQKNVDNTHYTIAHEV